MGKIPLLDETYARFKLTFDRSEVKEAPIPIKRGRALLHDLVCKRDIIDSLLVYHNSITVQN